MGSESELEQTDVEDKMFSEPAPTAVTGNGQRTRFDLQAYAREERMRLVQRLFVLPGSGSPRTVLFCGIGAENGSSLVCARTAETLASQVKTWVCMVDANWRFPSLHESLHTYNYCGLSDAVLRLGSVRNLARQINGGNLWLITAGTRVSEPHALLTSECFESRMAELKSAFNYILVDGPPVDLYADAMILGKLVDGVVLVLQANSTRREVATKARANLESAGIRVFGAVLNKRTFPIPDFLYNRV